MDCFGWGQKDLYCSVRLLDETELKLNVQNKTKGSFLLDRVFEKLNLLEKDYFGLRFLDSHDQTHWLDPLKPISKQIKNGPPYILYFGVKFYMENPCRLKEEVTRYQFFLQLRMDMLQGRLPCAFHVASELCAYATQSELGDYDPSQHSEGYISEFRFIPSQTEELEQQITQLHQKLKGMAPSKAELSFLERARWLEMYGVDLHPVLGENNVEFFLGLTPTGVVVYKNKTQVARYYWPRIAKVHFKDTEFTLMILNKDGLQDECVFKLSTRAACKHLWKCCVEQHAFFRLPQVGDEAFHQRKLSFSKSSFRHTGRTQREALEAASELDRPEQQVHRSPSRKYNRRPSQTDVSLKNAMASDDVFLDDSLVSPNSVVLRLSPQPVNRLPSNHLSGRESPTSGMSTRSVPWEDNQQARVGLFTPAGGSPVSVRSSNSRHQRHRGRSKSPGPTYRHGDRSDSESEAAYSARRRGRRSVASDAGSDTDSRHHHHHQHRKRRSRSRGMSSGSESEYSRHNGDRRRRGRSRERMERSDEQWNAHDESQMVRGELREGTEVVVKSLSDRFPDSENSYHNHLHHGYHHHYHHTHYHIPRQQSERKPSEVSDEFQKHIKTDLVDSEQFTEEERKIIPYTNIRIDGSKEDSYSHGHSRSRTKSRKNEDFSDSNISEHSARHRSKASSPQSHRHATRKSEDSHQLPAQPLGTPPPPYAHSGASQPRGHVHAARDVPLAYRGEVGSDRAGLVQNGEVAGHLTGERGLFGSHLHQERVQAPVEPQAIACSPAAQQTHGPQPHGRNLHLAAPHHRDTGQPPASGMEGLRIAHSREDSGLGNEHDDGESRQAQMPLQNAQPSSVVQNHSDSSAPLGGNADFRTGLHSTQAAPSLYNNSDLSSSYQGGIGQGAQPVYRTYPRAHDGTRTEETDAHKTHAAHTLHNGGPSYPSKMRLLPPTTQSRGIPNGGSVPGHQGSLPDPVSVPSRGMFTTPNQGIISRRGPIPNRGTTPLQGNLNNNGGARDKDRSHLWSKSVEPDRGLVNASPIESREQALNGTTRTENQGEKNDGEMADFPPGYKPNYNQGNKRYSITTQEMIRVSTLLGDHRDLQTEL